MASKNLLTLHEAISIALLSEPKREATFEQVASFIKRRKLFPNRKGGIPLETQIILRATKSRGNYSHLFEQVAENRIRLKDGEN